MTKKDHEAGLKILFFVMIITGIITLGITYMVRSFSFSSATEIIFQTSGFANLMNLLWLLGLIDFLGGIYMMLVWNKKKG